MKSIIITLLISICAISDSSIYDFSIEALDSDETIHLSDFKGKKILFVNVASKCGFTPQYKDLQRLYELNKDHLVILGLPCDQFAGQELNQESLIKEFCSNNYQVTFPMTTVIDVKGKNQHPIYQWLTQKDKNGLDDFKVSWNFNKFLVDENGKLIAHFDSKVNPLNEEITKHLK
ncbi:glutathione peroxidase [Fulvivirga sediminis]|uniref:Glutathione peroxidase n=1 Tax=Fulvivirga sediminis TaxID=2803949 RepID=A0A937JZG7_9BACT|nr:glutathione peroxidase [Fulvivirga sediminis]MBL3655181.1 glutathione peroxidase [Fulvivirga sediminis]